MFGPYKDQKVELPARVTNPIDIRFHLRKLNVGIIAQSAAPGDPEGIVEELGRLPIVRSMSSSTFLVGRKCDSH